MKIYISGKMRGLPENESRELFKTAEQYLTGLGHDVVNPWNSELEKDASCNEWADYIMFDLNILKTCDAIYMLDNWEDSWGAKCEYAFACGRGMEIIYETKRSMTEDGLYSLPRMIGGARLTEREDWNLIKEQTNIMLKSSSTDSIKNILTLEQARRKQQGLMWLTNYFSEMRYRILSRAIPVSIIFKKDGGVERRYAQSVENALTEIDKIEEKLIKEYGYNKVH